MLHLRDPEAPAPLADSLILMKFWLVVAGIYFWEYVSSLSHEWNVIRGRQRYRWTIWVYSLARFATLMVVILNVMSFYNTSGLNCQAMATSAYTFALLALGSGSMLIVLRIFAIWNRKKVIVGVAAGIWVVNFAFLLAAVVQIRATLSPVTKACEFVNVETTKISFCSLLVTDLVLLSIMLTGLLRLRRGGGSFELGRLLWKQGVIWLAIATVAEVPQALFQILNLNGALDAMFMMPSLVAMTIAATRIYRSLSHFASPPHSENNPDSDESGSASWQGSSRLVSANKNAAVVQLTSDQLEVSVRTIHEEEPPMSRPEGVEAAV